jgi:predicted HTH transcriptional regulator
MKTEARAAEQYIRNLIKSGENQQLDFKFEINDAKKIARSFSAFANTQGGKLLIGVKDNGKISGVRSEEEAYMAESAAHLFCRPAVNFHLKKWMVEGRCILEVEIPASSKRPHYAKNESGEWVAYVRVADQNIKASRILVNVWKSKNRKEVWLSYGREEKILMEYLAENETISLSRFVRIARTNRLQAEKILVNLILMDVIEAEITVKAVLFRLRRDLL